MTSLARVCIAVYVVAALVCWRVVCWSYIDDGRRVGADMYEDLWVGGLFFGFLAGCIWPLVLLFWRPAAKTEYPCPVCGAANRNCHGKVTSDCGPQQ